jgi:hypothetical protein
MSLFQYRAKDGSVIELERPIGQAPKSVTRKGVKFARVYTMPMLRELTPMERGDKPSVSHQLPTYYGYRQREKCWSEFMQKHGLENTHRRRSQCIKAGIGPTPRYIERRSREAAAQAGALDRFDKRGRVIARSKREVGRNLDTAKKLGDSISWD